ncbi:MAG: hypothetical protein R2799_16465 [Crocinitomicaceae bacterium]
MMLYKFEKLNEKLDNLGYPKIDGKSGFQLIQGIDFEKAYKSGSISFEDDGIYLEYNGKKHRGYMFIQNAYITYNGAVEKFPKFHLLKCKVISDFIQNGTFNQRYEWSNSHVNNLVDRQTRTKYNEIRLNICSYCQSDIIEDIQDTEIFFNSLDKEEVEIDLKEVDIFGYEKGKEIISKKYRESRNFTCENCGVKPNSALHRKWWHTHHINGDKTNNSINNLNCLCLLCHSRLDDRHIENFSKGSWPNQIDYFKKIYLEELQKIDNPYIKV